MIATLKGGGFVYVVKVEERTTPGGEFQAEHYRSAVVEGAHDCVGLGGAEVILPGYKPVGGYAMVLHAESVTDL